MKQKAENISGWISGPFRDQEIANFHLLDELCFPPDIAYSPEHLESLLRSPRCFTWVIEDAAGVLTGFIIVQRRSQRGSLMGHVITIDVRPEARRQGIGRMLLEAAELEFKQAGAKLLRLEVADGNEAALAFYLRLGFVEAGRIRNYYAGRLDAHVMKKAI